MCQWIGSFIQKQILDRFHSARTFALNAFVWCAIRMASYEVPYESVSERRSPHRKHADLSLEGAGDLDGLAAHAKAQVTEATARRTIVTDKCKTLFTFNSALLALIAVFQAKTADLASWEFYFFFAAVFAFVTSLLVVWMYFDIGGELVTPLEQDWVRLNKDDLKKALINENLRCTGEFENRTDFLVDLYRVSRFYLLTGFLLLFIVFSHHFVTHGGVVAKPAEPPKAQIVITP